MIIDCFNFYNETEILHMRLDYLYDTVDKFIIVESLDSHSKKLRKEQYVFEENISIYEQYMDKIIYLKIDNLPHNDDNPWANENYQKNYCAEGFLQIQNLQDNDWILFSDLDEIPNKNIIEELKNYDKVTHIRFLQKLFYYNVNILQNQIWEGTVGIKKQYFQSMMDLRNNRGNSNLYTFNNGGWHYSYMGGTTKIFTKMQSYAESNENINYCNLENIKNSIENINDLLGRTDTIFIKNIVDIFEEGMAPSNIQKMLDLYPYLLKNNKIKISYVCLIYKSTKWLQFVYDQLLKFTNLDGNEFFFVANDAHSSVLQYLKNKKMPHYIHNNTDEQKKDWYINNVYRAWNYGAKMAKGEYIIFINSDMAFTPGWSEKLMDTITENTCVTSRLVERGILRSGTYGIERNFGNNYDDYMENEFIQYVNNISENVLRDGGLYMPLLIKKEHLEKVNYYPEGNILYGSDMFNPQYATPKDDLIPGDNILMAKLASIGIHHKTNFDSIIYHFQQGEMLEVVQMVQENTNNGWLVNDTLTCIPNTHTFWHFLLENIDGLLDKTNGYTNFNDLPINIENALQHVKPKYIIRNATYFRKLQSDVYTISILQDNHLNNPTVLSQQKDVLANTNLTIANSKYVYNLYKNHIVNDYKIIPLGTNFNIFKPCIDLNMDVLPQSILYIGSSSVYPKGFDRLLKIMIEMPEQNFCLIMKDDYNIDLLPKECLGRVKIFNLLTEKEIVPIINSCVMGICTSYEETQHLSGVEICACNKPMVATNVGWYHDLSDSKEWGLIANDITFINKINYVLENLNKFNPRECLLKRGYDMESCKKSWIEIIKNVNI